VQRVFGATAVFAAWMSLAVGVVAGLVASQFLGLSHVEGDLPPMAVYGISAEVVIWTFIAAAVLMAVPMARAMFAADPRRLLLLMAVAMAIIGVAIIPDALGRAFGLPLLAGAVCLAVGAELLHGDAVARATAGAAAATDFTTAAPNWPESAQAGSPPRPPDAVATPAVTASTPQSPQPAQSRGRGSSRQRPAVSQRVCQWCSAAVPAKAEFCPTCHATLNAPADSVAIPGLTEVPPHLKAYVSETGSRKKRRSLLSMMLNSTSIPEATAAPPPSDAAALRPPSPEIRAEMARLDAEIATGGVPLGDETNSTAEPAEPAEPA
jgi:hypothetical protein